MENKLFIFSISKLLFKLISSNDFHIKLDVKVISKTSNWTHNYIANNFGDGLRVGKLNLDTVIAKNSDVHDLIDEYYVQ